ncbi:amino acid/amide ABC transporter ATP-binding protein 2, HAAT family [Blastococcus sp. DSM 46786]|uniref:ABC transporter ATP-binding protein n=1 Tax=Blastococcus sp. DSM 46786 TaxID=1798227 RepID=UPI0008B287C6|nr:ABC transporter ATP-binding protein [Blastococcus sp. DSM 46786]SEK90360.1 amino acid/amide ABC transporter ATP-binding protein 2, HAAT family [Blastococcus sp. DSM 46786]
MSGQGGAPLLRMSDVHVRLSGSHILQGVDLTVRRGGVTALLGRNGAGKTTTVKAVLGLVPSTGVIELTGGDGRTERVDGRRTHEIVRRGIGYAPEDREVFAGLTVAENLALAERRGSDHHHDRVYELFPELQKRSRQLAGTLSGGQQQMVAIARLLLNDNQLLLIDEPTKGLAPLLVAEVADVLARAAEEVTILLVEQNLTVVQRMAQDAVVIDQGRVAWSGPADDLLTDADRTRELLGVAASGGGDHR